MDQEQHSPFHNATSFQKGRPKTGGRVAGKLPAMPRLLKDCILLAAELEGSDGQGKDELVGFLRRLINEDIRAFAALLGRILPLQMETRNDTHVDVVYDTVEDLRAALEEQGISLEAMRQIMTRPMQNLIDRAQDLTGTGHDEPVQ